MRLRFLCCLITVLSAAPARAEQKLTIGGYLQAQYNRIDMDRSEPRDRAIFRRMVITFQAAATKDWHGTFQFDLAPAANSGDRVVVKDANLQYVGWKERGLTLTIGNQKPPFSRSLLTSSARRGLVERTFAGDRAFGSPGRALGIKLDATTAGHALAWSAEVASSLHAPDANQIRTDGLAEADSDWNEGVLVVGRVELQPRGELRREQSPLDDGAWRYSVGVAGYRWHNDGDRNLYTDNGHSTSLTHADTADVTGVEAVAAFRTTRAWLDAEFERIESATLDTAFTGGLYEHGRARVLKLGIESGYLIVGRVFELAGAYDVIDAGPFARPWQRVAFGASWYVSGHDVKFQAMHRIATTERGVAGVGANSTFIQGQIGF